MQETIKNLVGPDKPVKYVTTFRSVYNPNLFISQAAFGGQTPGYACATGYSLNHTILKAVMEGYERSICSTPPKEGVIRAREIDLERKYICVNPSYYIPLTKKQLEKCHLKPFSVRRPIFWVKGERYLKDIPFGRSSFLGYENNDTTVMVPLDMVYYGFQTRDKLYYANSSGVAAHTDKKKAVELATGELVERDALMRLWASRLPLTEIELTGPLKKTSATAEIYGKIGRKLQVFQIPSEYGDVYLATIRGEEWPAFVCGASATLDGNHVSAIQKAIEEAEVNFNFYNNMANREISADLCTFPELHGLFYCNPRNAKELRFRISEKKAVSEDNEGGHLDKLYHRLNLKMVWLTKAEDTVKVVRVLSDTLIPISFGRDMFHYTHQRIKGWDGALGDLPHFFP